MGLQTQPPAGMPFAVINCLLRVVLQLRPVHWLQKEMLKLENELFILQKAYAAG